MDQTGVILMMNKRTYEKKGSRDVTIAHHEEKRAYTLCVAGTPAGCYDLDEGVGQVSDNWSTLGRSMVNDAMIT